MSQSVEYTAQINKDGHFPRQTREAIASLLGKLRGKQVSVKIAPFVKKRSSPQNAFWWGVVIPIIRQMFLDAGNAVSAEETHKFLVLHVWKHTKVLQLPDGEIIEVPNTSTNLSTTKWEEKITITRAWASEFDVIIPVPNEITGVPEIH